MCVHCNGRATKSSCGVIYARTKHENGTLRRECGTDLPTQMLPDSLELQIMSNLKGRWFSVKAGEMRAAHPAKLRQIRTTRGSNFAEGPSPVVVFQM